MRGARRAGRGSRRRGLAGVIAGLTEGLSWWQSVLVVGPFVLAIFGGLIGGVFGGAGTAGNLALARSRLPVAVKAVSMTCVAVLVVVAYFNLAFAVRGWLSSSSSFLPAATPQLGAPGQAGLPQPAPTPKPASCTSAGPAASAAPARARAEGADPVTMPGHSGVTSAHADEVSLRLGRGESVDYVGPAARVAGRYDSVLVTAGQWIIELEPQHGEAFTCGTYHGVPSGNPGGGARLFVSAPGPGCADEDGTLTVYQFATGQDGALTRLNATLSQACGNSAGGMAGLIRYNATIPTPVPSLPSSAQPVTPPPHSGTTSAYPDQLSWLSAPGDDIGGGRPVHYTGSSVRAGVSGSLGRIEVNIAGWIVQLTAPDGEQLTTGTYPDATGTIPGAGPVIDIFGNGRGCDVTHGSFTIYQIASAPDGALTQLNATFSQTCDNSAGPLVGLIRYNATIPTPVPVLPASPGA